MIPARAAAATEYRSFFWLPVAGLRHAIEVGDRHVPDGRPVRTLCGLELAREPVTDLEWLAGSCWECWPAAERRQPRPDTVR